MPVDALRYLRPSASPVRPAPWRAWRPWRETSFLVAASAFVCVPLRFLFRALKKPMPKVPGLGKLNSSQRRQQRNPAGQVHEQSRPPGTNPAQAQPFHPSLARRAILGQDTHQTFQALGNPLPSHSKVWTQSQNGNHMLHFSCTEVHDPDVRETQPHTGPACHQGPNAQPISFSCDIAMDLKREGHYYEIWNYLPVVCCADSTLAGGREYPRIPRNR